MSTLTIIPDDKVIIVDGVAVEFTDNIDIDSDIHAVQWNGSSGHVEYKSKDNTTLSSNEYESYITLHSDEKTKQEQAKNDAETAALAPLYERNRLSEYGSVGEQLDMLYWDGKNGTTLWQDHIDTIKTRFPKE